MISDSSEKTINLICLGIICILILLSLQMASQRGLWSSIETQSALIAREFSSGDDLIVPHLNGAEDNEKPAFYYWLIAFISLFFGSVNELSSRLPSLLSVVFIMALLYFLNKKTKPTSVGLIAAAIFITNPKVFWMSQVARIDMVFSMLCFSSLVSFALYREGKNEKSKIFYYYTFFIATGLAVLCKGPAGMIIPSVPVFLYLLKNKDFKEMKHFFAGPGLIVFFMIVLPWYVLVTIKTEGRFFFKFILHDNIGRFIGPTRATITQEFSKRQPLWFYVPRFLSDFFPWSFFFPFLSVLFF